MRYNILVAKRLCFHKNKNYKKINGADMSKISFGEIDWNSAETTTQSNNKSAYMRLKEGNNDVRILSNPIQYYVHWVETDQGKRKIVSPIDHPELVSKLEDRGFRRQVRWILKVIDRSDNTPKLLEVGSQIFNGLLSIIKNPKWGNANNYDMTIKRLPVGSNPLYQVTPNPKEKLSSDLKDTFNTFSAEIDIDKIITPATAEKVCELLNLDKSKYVQEEDNGYTEDDFDFDF